MVDKKGKAEDMALVMEVEMGMVLGAGKSISAAAVE